MPIPDDYLQVYPEQTLLDVKKKLGDHSYSRLRRMNVREDVSESLKLDLVLFRTDEEIDYGYQLFFLRVLSELHTREPAASRRAMLVGVLLHAEFRYLRKREKNFSDMFRW